MLNVWCSAKIGALVGATIGGIPGFLFGTIAGVFAGVLINIIFYTEINGNSIAGHLENGVEWILESI